MGQACQQAGGIPSCVYRSQCIIVLLFFSLGPGQVPVPARPHPGLSPDSEAALKRRESGMV